MDIALAGEIRMSRRTYQPAHVHTPKLHNYHIKAYHVVSESITTDSTIRLTHIGGYCEL